VLKVPLNTNQPTNLMQAHGMALISVSIAVSQVPTYRVRPCCVALNCTSVTGAHCSYPLMDGRVSGATWLVTYPPADVETKRKVSNETHTSTTSPDVEQLYRLRRMHYHCAKQML